MMTESQARQWVRDHADDDQIDQDELEEVYAVLYGRQPDQQDRNEGLWSLVCAALDEE